MQTKQIFMTAITMFAAATMQAADYGKYYTNLPTPIVAVEPFTLPDYTISITDFGAKGDGITLCTEAIQNAIDKVSQNGGGHVNVPAGVWLTAPIELKDNVDLHLDKNAIVFLTPDKPLHVDSANPKAKRCRPGISAERKKN